MRGEVAQVEREPAASRLGSFMMARRIAKNCFALRGLVKKSAQLSTVETNGTLISNDSTMSRTKKWRRATCFVLSWCSGLYDRSRAPVLSVASGVDPVTCEGSSPESSFRE